MNQVALITGGTSGLGLAMSKALANTGKYLVYATGRKIPETNFDNITFDIADVTDELALQQLVDKIVRKHQRIDLLVNSAGIGIAAALEEIPTEKVQEAFDVNYFGTLRMIKAVVPIMRENKSGKIVNISSIGGLTSLPFQGVYSSTKFALEGMTEALSIELKPFGIDVCMIEPGDYDTNVSTNRLVVKPGNGSPYTERLNGFFDRLNNNVSNGLPPEKLGKLIVKIAKSKRPRLRYRSGRLFEEITPTVQRMLPDRLWENILEGFYKI